MKKNLNFSSKKKKKTFFCSPTISSNVRWRKRKKKLKEKKLSVGIKAYQEFYAWIKKSIMFTVKAVLEPAYNFYFWYMILHSGRAAKKKEGDASRKFCWYFYVLRACREKIRGKSSFFYYYGNFTMMMISSTYLRLQKILIFFLLSHCSSTEKIPRMFSSD